MLVIIVGGIPIAMPTVLSVTLALGAFKLAKEGAIVARMSAVEEMAGQSPPLSLLLMLLYGQLLFLFACHCVLFVSRQRSGFSLYCFQPELKA